MKGDIIKGYCLTSDWKVVGGMSEVAFAEKDGKEWFIKKFISPKFPTPDSPGSDRIKEQKRKKCIEFENRQKSLNSKISSKCGLGGNLVYAVDFFRVDTCYYKINEKIDVSTISKSEICRLKYEDVMIILKSLVHSLRIMHKENIVHGDLKPDNILIKATKLGKYTTKLIDFDDSYFSRLPPKDKEQVVGTPEYYSPELYDYILDEEDEISGDTLTTKSDIFALGVIFTEYLTGEKPIIPSKYSGTYSAVKDGAKISFKKTSHLTPTIESLLLKMLSLNASYRPNLDEIFDVLKSGKISLEKEKIESSIAKTEILKFDFIDTLDISDKVELEWCVVGAKEVRINNGFPLVHNGRKKFPIADEFLLTAKSEDGTVVEKVCKRVAVKVVESEKVSEKKETKIKFSCLRGGGLDIASKK